MSNETVWTGLAPAEADGRACVVCGGNFQHTKHAAKPVGRSRTGSQVFACAGDCADTAKTS
jgi:hypothetical protein